MFGAVAMVLVLSTGAAWAAARITVTREENKPQTLEVKAGEEVRWVKLRSSSACSTSIAPRTSANPRASARGRTRRVDRGSLEFLGAVGTVTGSKFLLEAGEWRVLVDCGLYQSVKALRQRNWEPPPVRAGSIDAIVLTHAHIDHADT